MDARPDACVERGCAIVAKWLPDSRRWYYLHEPGHPEPRGGMFGEYKLWWIVTEDGRAYHFDRLTRWAEAVHANIDSPKTFPRWPCCSIADPS